MPRFDTSFNFGANVAKKPKSSKGSKPKKKRPKGGPSKSRKHFGAMYGS
jgi:hypothetical protein